jgi:SHS family sialic acid transporter-like MFS transporter
MQSSPSRNSLYLALMAGFLGWMFDGMEMGIFPVVAGPALKSMSSGLGPVELKAFVSQWMSYATAAFLFGAASGGLVFGWLGDKIGRVRSMNLSILFYSIFTGMAYFAIHPWHLCACRTMAGLGMGGEWSLGVALVMEIWPEQKRPLLAALIGAASNVGFAGIAIMAIFIPVVQSSWRWVFLVGAAPALLTFVIQRFVPESERWKESVKGGHTHPLRDIFKAPLLKRTLMAIILASVALVVTWGAVQWLALVGQERSLDPRAKGVTQALSAIGAIFGCFLGAWLGKFGRRKAYFLLCSASLAVCVYLFRFTHHYDMEFWVSVFLVGAFTASFYGWLPLYLPELFPTRVRATAQGISFNSGRILAGVGVLEMGRLVPALGGTYERAGTMIALVYIIGMIAVWFAPETRGQPLPD